MEITTAASFADYYERVRERTNKIIRLIPPDKIDWAYQPGKFSMGDIVRHLAVTERWMFAENIQGKHSLYKTCGKELADGYDEVVAYFNSMHEESMAIFRNLSDEDLQRKCKTPGGNDITVWKWLRAMIEHEIHHRAQLYIYLNMLGIKTPPIFGLSEEEMKARSLQQQIDE